MLAVLQQPSLQGLVSGHPLRNATLEPSSIQTKNQLGVVCCKTLEEMVW